MIDWTKDVQVASLDKEDWESFVVIFPNEGHVYGHMPDEEQHDARMWHFDNWRFRNNPAEPKPLRGWINIYRSRSCGALFERKNQADCVASPDRIACVEIDIPEGYGLEERK